MMENAVLLKNHRAIRLCLELLNDNYVCPVHNLLKLNEPGIQLIESIILPKGKYAHADDYDEERGDIIRDLESNGSLAQQVLRRIQTAKNYSEASKENETQASALNKIIDKYRFSRSDDSFNVKSLLFQLSESKDIERVTYLFDLILTRFSDKFDEFARGSPSSSQYLPRLLSGIIMKYCDGDFGFENSDSTKFCLFQGRLFALLNKLLSDYDEVRTSVLLGKDFFDNITQVNEEAFVYILQAVSERNLLEKYEIDRHLENLIDLLTTITKPCYSQYHPAIENCVVILINRISSYFATTVDGRSVCDVEELSAFYGPLSQCFIQLQQLQQKVSSLMDAKENSYHNHSKIGTTTKKVMTLSNKLNQSLVD